MAEKDEDDDYLTMTFDDSISKLKNETLTQKKKRLAREAEERSRPKSKAQLAEEAAKKREAALNKTEIDTTSKAYKMMAALGYKPGTALGKAPSTNGTTKDDRLLEPIGLDMKDSRSGIGADSEKKRKFREEVEKEQDTEKRQKVEASEFRERQRLEREEQRLTGQVFGAMKVAERLDDEDHNENPSETRTRRPLSQYNVLWRGLVKQRLQKERDRRVRHDFDHSLSRLPTYEDSDEDVNDKIALDRRAKLEEVDLELDEDDVELDEFEQLPTADKLEKLTLELRNHWHYCFWCKFRYADADMDGCPGSNEDDHD